MKITEKPESVTDWEKAKIVGSAILKGGFKAICAGMWLSALINQENHRRLSSLDCDWLAAKEMIDGPLKAAHRSNTAKEMHSEGTLRI